MKESYTHKGVTLYRISAEGCSTPVKGLRSDHICHFHRDHPDGWKGKYLFGIPSCDGYRWVKEKPNFGEDGPLRIAEFEIGEHVTTTEGVTLLVIDSPESGCEKCYFAESDSGCDMRRLLKADTGCYKKEFVRSHLKLAGGVLEMKTVKKFTF